MFDVASRFSHINLYEGWLESWLCVMCELGWQLGIRMATGWNMGFGGTNQETEVYGIDDMYGKRGRIELNSRIQYLFVMVWNDWHFYMDGLGVSKRSDAKKTGLFEMTIVPHLISCLLESCPLRSVVVHEGTINSGHYSTYGQSYNYHHTMYIKPVLGMSHNLISHVYFFCCSTWCDWWLVPHEWRTSATCELRHCAFVGWCRQFCNPEQTNSTGTHSCQPQLK